MPFSYVAHDPVLSEERWVDLVGKSANVTVHKVGVNPKELSDDLGRLDRDARGTIYQYEHLCPITGL